MVEEQWEEGVRGVDSSAVQEKKENNTKGSRAATKKKTKKATKTNNGTSNELDEDYPMTETDSDDDDDSSVCSTDSEFEQYDLEESDDDDVAKTNLQLRDIISLIQKSETDWKGHVRALRSAEALIRAAPDELTHYAVPLARTLLLTTAPAWADEELPRGEDPIEDQRFRSLVALTAAAPEPVGLSLAAEVYSPSLDVQQRSRALAVMAAAAQELASPGSILKALEGGSDGSGTEITKSTQKYLQGEKVPGKAGRVVRASERSLAAAAAEGKGNQNLSSVSKANRFPPVALKWAAALLKECDVQRHGVDLFGRDHFILGRLLATLGTFLEASQQSTEAAPLAAAVIELIKGQNVHDNEEPYVRKAALMAASHACMAVPAGSIATALLPAALSSATGAGAVARSSSSASTALVERLEWMREWAEEVAQHDSDKDCRMMAAACRGLQGALSAEAMASLAASVSEQQSLGGGAGGANNVILPSFSGGVGSIPSMNVTIPRIESLNLK
jgi:telomere length regulation protein